MSEIYLEFEHAGLTVRICHDDTPEWANPREHDGNLGVMFCDYRGYTLGDKDAPDPRGHATACRDCDGSGTIATFEIRDRDWCVWGGRHVRGGFPTLAAAERYMERHSPPDASWLCRQEECPTCEGTGEVEASIIEHLRAELGATVILPLMVYEHSGITMWSKSSGQFA